MPVTITLKRNGGKPMSQIKIGNAHNGNFLVKSRDKNNSVIKETNSEDLNSLDQKFPLADSAAQLELGIVRWNVKVIKNNGNPDDPYIFTIEIKQDGQGVKIIDEGVEVDSIVRSGHLNQGVRVRIIRGFVVMEG